MAHKGRHGADEALAAALAVGQTVRSAAQGVGISEQTAWRRLRSPKFKAKVAELRQRMVSEACGKLADGLSNATDVLRCLLASDDEKVALRAALAHLQEVIKLRDATELEERVAALEQAARERKNGSGVPPPPTPPDEPITPDDDRLGAGEERIDNGGGDGVDREY